MPPRRSKKQSALSKKLGGLGAGKKTADLLASVNANLSKPIPVKTFPWVTEHEGETVKPHHTITATELAKRHGAPRRNVVQYLRTESRTAKACRTMPFTLVFVVSYAIMAIAHDDALSARAVEISLERDIWDNARYSTSGEKGLYDIASAPDIYAWLREGLIPLLFVQRKPFREDFVQGDPRYIAAGRDIPPEDRGYWKVYNRIAGGLRLVQERSNVIECTKVTGLETVDTKCVGGFDYTMEPELGLPDDRAILTVLPQRKKWLYIFDDIAVVQAEVTDMESGLWIDRQTQKVEIAIPIYNAEFGVHSLVRISLYFSRGGGIWKSVIVKSQYANWHAGWYYFFYDFIWIVCLFYIAVDQVMTLKQSIKVYGPVKAVKDHLTFYNFVDIISVGGGGIIILSFLSAFTVRMDMNKSLSELAQYNMVTQRETYIQGIDNYYDKLDANLVQLRTLRFLLAIYPVIVVMRLVKAFSAQDRLSLVIKTFKNAGPDLVHFAVVFFAVFSTLTTCSLVLYGRTVAQFATFARASVSAFRIMMNQIEWGEMTGIGKVWAAFWMWIFIFLVIMLMLNMILAIIMQHYTHVKEKASSQNTLIQDALQLWSRRKQRKRGAFVNIELICPSIEHHYDDQGQIVTVEGMMEAVQNNAMQYARLTAEQAEEILANVCFSYYERSLSLTREGGAVEDIFDITEALHSRVKKLVKKTRKATLQADQGPSEEVRALHADVNLFVTEIFKERTHNLAELRRLSMIRSRLRDQLARYEAGNIAEEAQAAATGFSALAMVANAKMKLQHV
eukprot:TRINITY_DN39567_c0_g1_i1.p1 TRINITY_DN39567_c0_g1~~TRINITY_DN39567_c0_g1_i1.p1  ORF type:complete len:789 (+),score=198.48 TRINITY_DN39567_c0_g1_i1:233-2599(+)